MRPFPQTGRDPATDSSNLVAVRLILPPRFSLVLEKGLLSR